MSGYRPCRPISADRISPHLHTTDEDVGRLFSALATVC